MERSRNSSVWLRLRLSCKFKRLGNSLLRFVKHSRRKRLTWLVILKRSWLVSKDFFKLARQPTRSE